MGVKSVYKLMDGKGRILIPIEMRSAAGMNYGDIVKVGLMNGSITVQNVELIEIGDQSPEAVEAYVRTAIKLMADDTRISLISDITSLLQQKGEG